MDVFSRYVVGWMVAHWESATLAERLIEQTMQNQQIQPGQLTLHADRGAAMTSKAVSLLLCELGITKTHSRPRVSNDNPDSEAQFKTLKYQPQFPKLFGSMEDARIFCQTFFDWYNHDHHHTATHPERFVRGLPLPPAIPTEAWINPPPPTRPVPQEQH